MLIYSDSIALTTSYCIVYSNWSYLESIFIRNMHVLMHE
nr:MAG TPA: hypothetical protein [Caudoviricetes sp.]